MLSASLTVSACAWQNPIVWPKREQIEPETLTQEQRIARNFNDLERAIQLAFDAEHSQITQAGEIISCSRPDLPTLAKLLELAFKANGVLTADGKRSNADAPVTVPIEEIERLLKAAKSKVKPNDSKES